MDKRNGSRSISDKQFLREEILARIDELDKMSEITTDRETLERIAERKKVLSTALEAT